MELLTGYLFKGLSEDQLKKIAAIGSEVGMEEGERIFTEGDQAESVYVLKEGAVEMMSRLERDFDLPISMLREPGDIFGCSALVSPHTYSLSARAGQSGTLLKIRRMDLEELNRQDRYLACIMGMNLAEYFLDRLKETRHQVKIHFKILLGSTRS